jgi:hypothetical protein
MPFPDFKLAVRLSGFSWLVLSAHAAGAVEGGVFCRGAGIFVERPEPNGALTFDIMDANAQGNVIEITGVAAPHKGGWRYQSNGSAAEARCTLDITPVAGGFKMDTVKVRHAQAYIMPK